MEIDSDLYNVLRGSHLDACVWLLVVQVLTFSSMCAASNFENISLDEISSLLNIFTLLPQYLSFHQ